jgi:hypothetical protein
VPTDAALAAVTNPDNLAMGGSGDALRALRQDRVVDELCEAEGVEAGEAKALALDAISHLGGRIDTKHSGGLRPGSITRRLADVREEWLVPASAIRT